VGECGGGAVVELELFRSAKKSSKDQIHTGVNPIYRRKTINSLHTGHNGGGGWKNPVAREGDERRRNRRRKRCGEIYFIATHQWSKVDTMKRPRITLTTRRPTAAPPWWCEPQWVLTIKVLS
jgi:hypothetical protein